MTRIEKLVPEYTREEAWLNWLGIYAIKTPEDFIEHTFDLIYRDADVRDAFLKLTGDWFDQDSANQRRFG